MGYWMSESLHRHCNGEQPARIAGMVPRKRKKWRAIHRRNPSHAYNHLLEATGALGMNWGSGRLPPWGSTKMFRDSAMPPIQ